MNTSRPIRESMSAAVVAACAIVLLSPIPGLTAGQAMPSEAAADDAAALFPFVVSYDAPSNITNISFWLERPAGKRGFVHAEGGRLVVGNGDAKRPIRFWATNLCFEACFPTREQADRLAARLARLGINCVRMHHMDNYSIWGDSPNKLTIDPKKLDRLDYLIYQLKLHGIYTNLNLHVSRWFDKAEGFVARDQRPQFDKGLDNFEPRMIELQKKYARDLLTHVNPYTKTAYTNEPAVAFVEINNENALFAEWGWGNLDRLPEPYAGAFRKLWNAWLRTKHGDTAALRRAWNVQQQPLGDELLANGDFSRPLPGGWYLEKDEQVKAEWSVQPKGPEGSRSLRIVVTRSGQVSWRPQLTHAGFSLKKSTPYTLAFSVRSDKPRQLHVNCMMAHEPWERLGLDAQIAVGPEWKHQRRTFVADRDDPDARITLSNLQPGTYELAAVSLRSGGTVGLGPDQRIEDQSVPVLQHNDLGSMTEPARADFMDFLYDTERDYWSGMHRFLKEELKVRPLVSGTQLGYSPVRVQAGLDYIDSHSYWNHPHFPNRPWDPKDWIVRNVALVNTPGGTLADLAARRVAGMAFTVSEYNHPEPNVYAAEGFPMIAAFGAMQAWDGVFNFTYSHDTNFEPRRITGFFDIKSVTPRLVHMPACAAMFLRGDVAPARTALVAPLPVQAERKKLHETMSAWRLTAGEFGVDPRLAMLHRIAIGLGESGTATPRAPRPAKDQKRFVSDTGELCWDVSQPGAGCFTVNSPRTRLFTGFVRGRTFKLGDVELRIGATRLDWATVSMVCLDGEGFDKPGRILVAATGWVQNQGAKLRRVGGEDVTLGDQWGSEPVLCEGVSAEILSPAAAGRVRLFPLDESGARRDAVPVEAAEGKAVLRLEPKHRTVWYEVEVR